VLQASQAPLAVKVFRVLPAHKEHKEFRVPQAFKDKLVPRE
jgi:hypothetical protein